LGGNLKERDHFENIDLDGSIILKGIYKIRGYGLDLSG
jgi:hypothetical protein